MISALGPWIIWPTTLLLNIIHSSWKIGKYHDVVNAEGVTESVLWYSSDSYIVTKILLFFIYNLIMVFVSFECMFPIYEWW